MQNSAETSDDRGVATHRLVGRPAKAVYLINHVPLRRRSTRKKPTPPSITEKIPIEADLRWGKKMRLMLLCVWCACFGGGVLGYHSNNGYSRISPRPQRAIMFGGYYSNPIFRRNYDLVPQGSMSAVVTRDTVATNSFAGQQPVAVFPPIGEIPLDENETVEKYTEKADILPPIVRISILLCNPAGFWKRRCLRPQSRSHHRSPWKSRRTSPRSGCPREVATETVLVTREPKRASRKQVTKKPVKEEEKEEEEEDGLPSYWPFASNKGSLPSYNAFFPVTIGGSGRNPSKSRAGNEDEDYVPGSGTAIANSFSTGKGRDSQQPRHLRRRSLSGERAEGSYCSILDRPINEKIDRLRARKFLCSDGATEKDA
ncbi:hypothetical protein NQ317_015496 [Molorchus minor]|uniref:Uncharacterized protein n=1 Tax=Molorchus minor TaxID=1323400 RepID=A0ABQ9JMY1_9CUCU|nr:hypothetical protein NQ317_015496 [Molorchus minor]